MLQEKTLSVVLQVDSAFQQNGGVLASLLCVLCACQVQKQLGRVSVISTGYAAGTLIPAIPTVAQKGYLVSQRSRDDIL